MAKNIGDNVANYFTNFSDVLGRNLTAGKKIRRNTEIFLVSSVGQ
jgi:hypothetical protein